MTKTYQKEDSELVKDDQRSARPLTRISSDNPARFQQTNRLDKQQIIQEVAGAVDTKYGTNSLPN